MPLTNTFRFKSWQLVRLRGRGPFGGSAWRVAAHIYRDRAINCMNGIRMAQEDLRTYGTAYTEAEQTIADLRAQVESLTRALEGAGRVEKERDAYKEGLRAIAMQDARTRYPTYSPSFFARDVLEEQSRVSSNHS